MSSVVPTHYASFNVSVDCPGYQPCSATVVPGIKYLSAIGPSVYVPDFTNLKYTRAFN